MRRTPYSSQEEFDEALEAIREAQERRALKNAIKSDLNNQFETLKEYAREQYKLIEQEGEILQIKEHLQNEFSGEAQEALNQRLDQHWHRVRFTNLSFPHLINSLSVSKGWFG